MPSKVKFHVIHVSGQDDNYKASELNIHSPTTKGWQSQRFCLYPQDLVLQLDKRVRLRKIQILSHQYLIPTKVEFYVGDVPDGTPVSLQYARYTRLGYVALSDNEKTGYKARELKSVHVDAVGVYLKLVIHKNHINKHNLYNQVGVIAVNVIGDNLNAEDRIVDGENSYNDPVMAGVFGRPDYISPLDDLAFDMYQDPEVAQIIRKLEAKKQQAVLEERYDYAKKLKMAITELQKVGEKLGKYEVEKRQAVESEDYDKAKLKKVQMDEYRLQVYKELDLHDLLETSGTRYQMPDLSARPAPVTEIQTPSPREDLNDERPLPALRSVPGYMKSPLLSTQQVPLLDDEEEALGEPEPMSEKDLREASSVIDVFGLQLVSKAYSKTWSYREDALLSVYKQMSELPSTANKEDARIMMRAAIFLILRGIKDKVFAVFKAALNLLRMILTDFVVKHKVPRGDTHGAAEKTVQALLNRSGDTATRIRDTAKTYIVEMARFPEVAPIQVIVNECVKPFKVNVAPRLGLSRDEVVHQLYKDLGLTNGLNVDNIMKFCAVALEHNSGEVREEAEKIIVDLYKEAGSPVKDYLPPDDERTRKNILYKQLFEAFDKIDGKPSKSDAKRQKQDEEAKKQKEIEQLQNQLAQLKDLNAAKTPADESRKPAPRKKQPSESVEDDNASTANDLDSTCIFCGERNSQFVNEENLDLHYWKHCPMLKRCTHCKQVVEIAGLTDHLLEECEARNNFSRCPRCTEAIDKNYEQHVKENACNAARKSQNHCPLCHNNIEPGEDGWKEHLMGQNGCKQNPRRALALDRAKGKAGGGVPRRISKPNSRLGGKPQSRNK